MSGDRRYLGELTIYSDGSVSYRQPFNTLSSLRDVEFVYRAAVGAQAAVGASDTESIVHLAASLLARAGAEKARRIREAAEQNATEATA